MIKPQTSQQARFLKFRKLTEVSRALTYAMSLSDVLNLTVQHAAGLLGAEKSHPHNARHRQRGYSSGDETAWQPFKVEARRPSVGQTRRRVVAAKVQAAAAQLPLFDSETLSPAWLGRWQRVPYPSKKRTAVKALQFDSDAASAAPALAPAPAPVVVPLMKRLGKPATFYAREQWMEKLVADPKMQGQLRRGRDVGRL